MCECGPLPLLPPPWRASSNARHLTPLEIPCISRVRAFRSASLCCGLAGAGGWGRAGPVGRHLALPDWWRLRIFIALPRPVPLPLAVGSALLWPCLSGILVQESASLAGRPRPSALPLGAGPHFLPPWLYLVSTALCGVRRSAWWCSRR